MARKPRIHYNGALYHVMARGNNKEHIFKSNEDKKQYLKRIAKYTGKYDAKILAYVLMDNHCHILIQVSEIPLSKIMQLIQQTYTAFYNKKYSRTGHIFEQRYKSILVDKDRYLLTLIKYIHQNPLENDIDSLSYNYSSHNDYIKGDSLIVSIDDVLSLLAASKKSAIERYKALMNLDFDTDVIANKRYSPKFKEVKSLINNNLVVIKSIDEVIDEFEQKHNICIDVLRGKRYKCSNISIRNEFIQTVLAEKVLNQAELARLLNVSISTVSKVMHSLN